MDNPAQQKWLDTRDQSRKDGENMITSAGLGCHTFSTKGCKGFTHIQATNWSTISRHFGLLGSVQFYL